LDMLAILVACLAHDVDHPGNNNAFEIRMNSAFAIKYNDVSVLENHHLTTLFGMLRKPGCNILAKLSVPQFRTARSRMVKGVLATDMDFHFEHCRHLDELLNAKNTTHNATMAKHNRSISGQKAAAAQAIAAAAAAKAAESGAPAVGLGGSPSASVAVPNCVYFDFKVEKERQFLFNTLVHAADILHSTTSTIPICEAWGERIAKEFGAQVVLEEQNGLPVSTFMAGLEKRANFALNQLNFAEKVCMPMLRPMAQMFKPLQQMEQNVLAILAHFREVHAQHKPK